MINTIGRYLRILIPFLCLWNAYLVWDLDTNLVIAWVVAFAGWTGLALEERKGK